MDKKKAATREEERVELSAEQQADLDDGWGVVVKSSKGRMKQCFNRLLKELGRHSPLLSPIVQDGAVRWKQHSRQVGEGWHQHCCFAKAGRGAWLMCRLTRTDAKVDGKNPGKDPAS